MDTLFEIRQLKKYFDVGNKKLKAVDGVDFAIKKGKTLGVVGESGCGKTTLGRTLIGLLPMTSGEIYYQGRNISDYSKKELKDLNKEMQIIFQDPYSSINPRHRIGTIIGEPLLVNGLIKNKMKRKKKVLELMDKVGLKASLYDKYPHELDGGRRQRIGVARALSVDPKFIVCDEPVSALDVSVQAQILNLLMDLQEEKNLTYMFITHDLSVVKHISDDIAVMYMGKCVEFAKSDELFSNPLHPYTKALMNAILVADLKAKDSEFVLIEGEISSPIDPPQGCRFASRCSYVRDECKVKNIDLKNKSSDHLVACILYD